MNQPIPASQLVLNSEGAIYHLNLHPDQLADDVIMVGDPGRVDLIASFFDKIEVKRQNRELITRTGYFNGKRITALSTGMGTDNLDIVMNELDALANIDLKTRMPKEEHRSLNLIRLGTCGALQPEIEVEDNCVATRYAIGLDGLLYFYEKHKEVNEIAMRDAFSMADLEALLPTVDRSTLFRTVGALTEAHLLHEIDDGSGAQKYCVCHLDDTRHCEGHVHLTCLRCHRTFCLTNVRIPPVPLPEGFQAEETEYVVKGICQQCSEGEVTT